MAPNRFDFTTALHQCAQGNQSALHRIYEHEAPQMMAYALTLLGSPSEAEELIRESFILSWKNAIGFDATLGDGRAWLYSIFRYRAQARLQHRSAHPDSTALVPTLPLATSATAPFLRSVMRLDTVSNSIVLMAYLQGHHYQQIAQRLSLPFNQVRLRARAALNVLHAAVAGWSSPNMGEQALQIAEYTLGLLSGTEQQQTRSLLQHHDHAAHDALLWELQLLTICDALRAVQPANQLLWRIQTALGHKSIDTPVHPTQGSAHSNTSFIPQLVRADSASSLSIPQRIETPPIAAASAQAASINASSEAKLTPPSASPFTTATQSIDTKQEAEQETEQTDSTLSNLNASLARGFTRFLPKKPEFGEPKAKAEPSLRSDRLKHTAEEPSLSAPNTKTDNPTPTTNSISSPAPVSLDEAELNKNTPKPTHEGTVKHPHPTFWRTMALGFAVIALALGIKLVLTPAAPTVSVIEMAPKQAAVLQAPGQSSTPGWILTVDPEGNVLLNPQVETQILESQSAQLWTQPASSTVPRSLGLIDPNRPVTLPHSLIGTLETGQIFEITLEAKGGSNSTMPNGPVLFIGRLVRFGDSPIPNLAEPLISEHS